MQIEPNKIYTPEAVAKILDVSERVMLEKKEVPFKIVQKKRFITGQALLDYLQCWD